MNKWFINLMIIITIPCFLCQSRIGRSTLDISKDQNGTNWKYFTSNSTLIFDNLYITSSGFTLYSPLVLLEVYGRPNFTLILRNENKILINEVGSFVSVDAFSFWGSLPNRFIIQETVS